MQLTDPLLPWLLGIVAAAAFVALVVGWPRPRHRIGRATVRGFTALLTNAAVIGVCFLVLNDSYVFYSDWSDVFGGGGGPVTIQRGNPTSTTSSVVGGVGVRQPAVHDYRLPQPGRLRQSFQVPDKASGTVMQVLVQLPVGYDPASARTYPVIIGLHGFPSVPASFTKINFLRTTNALTRSHRMASSIVVIPQINSPRLLDTECVNGPAGSPQTDTWLSAELPQWIVGHFHVSSARQDWATLGYSFGGWCAAELTMRHPALFAAAIVFEGYFEPDFGRRYHPLNAAERRPFDLVRLAQSAPPPVAIWLFTSRQDKLAYPTTERFIKVARSPLSINAVVVPTGGHRNSVFEPYTYRSLEWLARSVRGFRG